MGNSNERPNFLHVHQASLARNNPCEEQPSAPLPGTKYESPPLSSITRKRTRDEEEGLFFDTIGRDNLDNDDINNNSAAIDANSNIDFGIINDFNVDPTAQVGEVSSAVDLLQGKIYYQMGKNHLRGINGTSKDEYEAFKLFKASAEAGDCDGLNALGVCYNDGTGVEKEINQALIYFRLALEKGSVRAKTNLGIIFMQGGDHIQQDSGYAEGLLMEASQEGDSMAQHNLGIFLMKGVGIAQDVDRGLKLVELAAQSNDPEALAVLAACYYQGLGVQEDIHKAIEYFQKAANFGHLPSIALMGSFYLKGIGVEENESQAIYYYNQAANTPHNNSDAMTNLGVIYLNKGERGNIDRAIELFKKAATIGDSDAQSNLGVCYMEGIGGDRNPFKAIELFQMAAENGNKQANFLLGRAYDTGIGIHQDLKKALKHYRVAANNGHTEAKKRMHQCILEEMRKIASYKFQL